MLYLLLVAAGAVMMMLSWKGRLIPVRVGLFIVAGYVLGTADLLAYGLLRLYHYHPGLLSDPMQDSYLGEILAEMLFVPAMVSALWTRGDGGAVMIWLGTAAVTVIEVAFQALHVFHSSGWNPWYTALLFPGYYWAVKWWADRFSADGYTPLHRVVLILSLQGYA